MKMLGYKSIAKDVFDIEANAVRALAGKIDVSFEDAVSRILESKGRVIICGMGKSGIIGKKIAATLASTGTPSFFMHPGEAYHGDLGMVTPGDVFLAISNSGETDEVLKLIPFLKDNGNYLVSMTGNPCSTLARASDSHLDIGVEAEACPLQLAPTASTTATLAMGDALAVTLMKARGFRPEEFARFHPGGSLGRRLLARVDEEMEDGDLPFVDSDASVTEIINAMSRGRLGLAIVNTGDKCGVVTDGDIRRAVESYGVGIFEVRAEDFMSADPIIISKGTRVEDAIKLMDSRKITSVLVADNGNVVGVFKK
ncbi:SIS domain-containing protein [uncultured Microbulbifer sp.]|uniref:KpsF/GutQ family sugar-phosphate isomerase n=1 Tax=uncultured Microbulbifer sp. TaxID=348147 RepID=UPI00261296AF|nr:KpsF/GutQ family sugar-phosphate isomerase [uncultured Microbulbifer sp.]